MNDSAGCVLVVDDSRSARAHIAEILTSAGLSVVTAVDGVEGLEALEGQSCDVVVSDLEMPRLDGIGFCRAVKEDERFRSIYFIMLTACSEVQTKVSSLNIGANDYIVKNTHPEEVLARVYAGLRIRKLERDLAKSQARFLHGEKMASIAQLAAGVAHEINNPTGFIVSNLGTLCKYFERLGRFIDEQSRALNVVGQGSPELEGVLQKQKQLKIDQVLQDGGDLIAESLEGAQRIGNIVSNMRNALNLQEYESRPADLNQCMELAIDFVLRQFNISEHLKKEYGEIPMTCCYPNEINQVLINLLTNAAQAVSCAGEIRVSTWTEDEQICLSVSDDGGGILADHLPRIFDPFFTTREVGKGVGLGLSLAYDIVKKHEGDITVDSELGKGTKITVRLPVRLCATHSSL